MSKKDLVMLVIMDGYGIRKENYGKCNRSSQEA